MVAQTLSQKGFHIVFTGIKKEEELILAIDPEQKHRSLCGKLTLGELKTVIENAALLISPDTGVAHLAKLTKTPSITLFGPASAFIYGNGTFWKNHPSVLLTQTMPCRNQHCLFHRPLKWVQNCTLSAEKCPTPGACMDKIELDAVLNAAFSLLPRSTPQNFEK